MQHSKNLRNILIEATLDGRLLWNTHDAHSILGNDGSSFSVRLPASGQMFPVSGHRLMLQRYSLTISHLSWKPREQRVILKNLDQLILYVTVKTICNIQDSAPQPPDSESFLSVVTAIVVSAIEGRDPMLDDFRKAKCC